MLRRCLNHPYTKRREKLLDRVAINVRLFIKLRWSLSKSHSSSAAHVQTLYRVIVQSLKIKVFSLKQLQNEQVTEKFFFKCSRRITDVSFRSNEEKLYLILGEGKWRRHHAKQQAASASGMDARDK